MLKQVQHDGVRFGQPPSVCPELVEGLSFFCVPKVKGQGFDRLSPNGKKTIL